MFRVGIANDGAVSYGHNLVSGKVPELEAAGAERSYHIRTVNHPFPEYPFLLLGIITAEV